MRGRRCQTIVPIAAAVASKDPITTSSAICVRRASPCRRARPSRRSPLAAPRAGPPRPRRVRRPRPATARRRRDRTPRCRAARLPQADRGRNVTQRAEHSEAARPGATATLYQLMTRWEPTAKAEERYPGTAWKRWIESSSPSARPSTHATSRRHIHRCTYTYRHDLGPPPVAGPGVASAISPRVAVERVLRRSLFACSHGFGLRNLQRAIEDCRVRARRCRQAEFAVDDRIDQEREKPTAAFCFGRRERVVDQ
jgi:hypothetical protein